MGLRVSNNERQFVELALRQELRIDSRTPFATRKTLINFSKEDGAVEVVQGETRILAVVSAQIATPYPDRPNEGSLSIYTEFSPMADPAFEPGRPGESAIELGRVIDRGLRESKAVDTESLCVLAGKAVWALRIDIHILDNGGNLVDVANVAALAALLSFRRPECSIGDEQEVIIHPPEIREPLPLTLHHLPIAVTFAFLADGELMVLDPSLKEEAVMGGRLTVTANAHGEICAVQKGGGVGVSLSEVMRCLRIAASRASEIAALLKQQLETREIERSQRKIKRHVGKSAAKDIPMVDAVLLKEEVEEEEEEGESSDTDSEEEGEVKMADDDAVREMEMVAVESAAAVYRQEQQQQSKKSRMGVGPVVCLKEEEDDDVAMKERDDELEVGEEDEPTSLLDAMKKKGKKSKRKN